MNRLLLATLVATVGLVACSKEQPPATAANPHAGLPMGAPGGGGGQMLGGKVLQVENGGGYTYAEVDVGGGQKVWVAGSSIAIKPGDGVQWRDHSVMRNFNAKSLNKTFDQILFVSAWGPVGGNLAVVAPHGTPPAAPAQASNSMVFERVDPAARQAAMQQAAAPGGGNAGKVKSVANAGGYSYIEVDQGGGSLWLAVTETPVKAGDEIRWDGGAVMQNFNAKSLGRTFDKIVFAGGIQVVR